MSKCALIWLGMGTQAIRTAMVADYLAFNCIATMEPQTYLLDFGGGKTVSGTLSAKEWRLVNLLSSPGSDEDTHKGEN